MPTKANISRWKFRLGDGSPPQYTDVEEVKTVTGLGKTNKLIDVTSFDSPAGTMEYIAGLSDGEQITVTCNRIPNESPESQQQLLMAAVDAGETKPFQIAYTGVSPEETFEFLGVCISWKLTPSTTAENQIEFVVKISGDIVAE